MAVCWLSNLSSLTASYQSPTQRCSFYYHFWHTQTHTNTHKVPYAHLYSKAYTSGLRKSPFTGVSASMEALSLTHKHTKRGHEVSQEGPNCAALLEKWTLFYPLSCWIKAFLHTCDRISAEVDRALTYIAPQYRRALSLGRSGKQCTIRDATLLVCVLVCPRLSATYFFILTGCRGKEQGDSVLYLAGLRSSQEQPLKRSHLISGHTRSLWALSSRVSTLKLSRKASSGLERPINHWCVITTLQLSNDVNYISEGLWVFLFIYLFTLI